jgi:hypothetical protein
MHPLISTIPLASVPLLFNTSKVSVQARPARGVRNAQTRSSRRYALLDYYSAEDFMNER